MDHLNRRCLGTLIQCSSLGATGPPLMALKVMPQLDNILHSKCAFGLDMRHVPNEAETVCCRCLIIGWFARRGFNGGNVGTDCGSYVDVDLPIFLTLRFFIGDMEDLDLTWCCLRGKWITMGR